MAERIGVLVIGGGGREHALGWKIAQSRRCGRLHAAPGNGGLAAIAECHPVPASDVAGLAELARDLRVGLAVVGPEAPLAAGLADRLRAAGVRVFGPSAAAARIESSKAYARELMARHGVPQPSYRRFRALEAAEAHLAALEASGTRRAVVKASGLAAGKGAIVCEDLAAAAAAARELLVDRCLGEAGEEILIEERLAGEEVSLLVLTDGRSVLPLLPAQDYKRARDGDAGPNTGGMGSHAPAPALTPALLREAVERIVRPVLAGLARDGAPFQGCLYAGLIRTPGGLRVIEFNCRFGDPEAQAILPLLDTDLLELLLAAAQGDLGSREVRWRPGCAVSVVLASSGYPGTFTAGHPISGLEEAAVIPGVHVFHAGTARRDGSVITAGGRVLNVTGTGRSFAGAIAAAYAGVDRIRFEGRQFRTDIGARVREAGEPPQEKETC